MRDQNDTILVFTSESLGSLLAEGGSQAWKLNAPRAARCNWVLCVRSRHTYDHGRQGAGEPLGAAFLLGRIDSLTAPTQPDTTRRWKIGFGEFAHMERPGVWDGHHNPVRYGNLAALGIDPAHLVFRPVRLWGGWSGMAGPSGYRRPRQETMPPRSDIAAEGGRR